MFFSLGSDLQKVTIIKMTSPNQGMPMLWHRKMCFTARSLLQTLLLSQYQVGFVSGHSVIWSQHCSVIMPCFHWIEHNALLHCGSDTTDPGRSFVLFSKGCSTCWLKKKLAVSWNDKPSWIGRIVAPGFSEKSATGAQSAYRSRRRTRTATFDFTIPGHGWW